MNNFNENKFSFRNSFPLSEFNYTKSAIPFEHYDIIQTKEQEELYDFIKNFNKKNEKSSEKKINFENNYDHYKNNKYTSDFGYKRVNEFKNHYENDYTSPQLLKFVSNGIQLPETNNFSKENSNFLYSNKENTINNYNGISNKFEYENLNKFKTDFSQNNNNFNENVNNFSENYYNYNENNFNISEKKYNFSNYEATSFDKSVGNELETARNLTDRKIQSLLQKIRKKSPIKRLEQEPFPNKIQETSPQINTFNKYIQEKDFVFETLEKKSENENLFSENIEFSNKSISNFVEQGSPKYNEYHESPKRYLNQKDFFSKKTQNDNDNLIEEIPLNSDPDENKSSPLKKNELNHRTKHLSSPKNSSQTIEKIVTNLQFPSKIEYIRAIIIIILLYVIIYFIYQILFDKN